jgi:DNA-binding transcriptional ArsR family regulator
MPRLEDLPKKNFKPKRRNSWDVASIFNEQPNSHTAILPADCSPNITPPSEFPSRADQEYQSEIMIKEIHEPTNNDGDEPEPFKNNPGLRDKHNNSKVLQEAFKWSPQASIGPVILKEVSGQKNTITEIEESAEVDVDPKRGLRKVPEALLKTKIFVKSRHKADTTNSYTHQKEVKESTDTEPTQSRHRKFSSLKNTDTESRHRTDTNFNHTIKADTEPTPNPTQSRHRTDTQSDTNRTTKSAISPVWTLRGLKLRLLDFLCGLSMRTGSKFLGPISYETLSKKSGVTEASIRTTLKRLRDDGYVKISWVSRGPGACIQIEVKEASLLSYGDNLTNQRLRNTDTEPTQSRHPIRHKADTQSDTNVSSSSSPSLDLTLNKTSTSETRTELSFEWLELHFGELAQIGFGKVHIQQLAERGKRTPEEVQTSIDAFAFDLTVNQKAPSIKNPLGYFMGILHRGPYAVPVNFEAPEVRQRKAYLAAEEKKNAQLRELDERILQSEFEKWDRALELEEKLELAPIPEAVAPGGVAHKSILKEYFRENLWPVIENKIRESNF